MPDEFLTPFDLPGYDAWKTDADAAPDPGRVRTIEQEDARERCWWEFEMACREFAAIEPDGWSAVLRAVARAMQDAK